MATEARKTTRYDLFFNKLRIHPIMSPKVVFVLFYWWGFRQRNSKSLTTEAMAAI